METVLRVIDEVKLSGFDVIVLIKLNTGGE